MRIDSMLRGAFALALDIYLHVAATALLAALYLEVQARQWWWALTIVGLLVVLVWLPFVVVHGRSMRVRQGKGRLAPDRR